MIVSIKNRCIFKLVCVCNNYTVKSKKIKEQKEYHCGGSFTLLHRGKPDKKDLKEAAEFAKKITNK
ncbi:hypothetical protein [Clostridium grantii]|uniref:hypothetical protein n=1 Tax=Clostridium grantii TaxID=40575 RepID=UPI00190F0798|nr:hypothetical protein [Clostridium grantii]